MNIPTITDIRDLGFTHDEQIQVNQVKSEIRAQLEGLELAGRVKKSIAIMLEWNHLKPTVWREISTLLSVLANSPEHKNLFEAFGPLLFAVVSKMDITTLHLDKIQEVQNRHAPVIREHTRYGL